MSCHAKYLLKRDSPSSESTVILAFQSLTSPFIKLDKSANSDANFESALFNSFTALVLSFPEVNVISTEIIDAVPLRSKSCFEGETARFDLIWEITFCKATCVSASSHNGLNSFSNSRTFSESLISILALEISVFLADFFCFFFEMGNAKNWPNKDVFSANLCQVASTPFSRQYSRRACSSELYSSFQSSFFNCLLTNITARRNTSEESVSRTISSREGSQSSGVCVPPPRVRLLLPLC